MRASKNELLKLAAALRVCRRVYFGFKPTKKNRRIRRRRTRIAYTHTTRAYLWLSSATVLQFNVLNLSGSDYVRFAYFNGDMV